MGWVRCRCWLRCTFNSCRCRCVVPRIGTTCTILVVFFVVSNASTQNSGFYWCGKVSSVLGKKKKKLAETVFALCELLAGAWDARRQHGRLRHAVPILGDGDRVGAGLRCPAAVCSKCGVQCAVQTPSFTGNNECPMSGQLWPT